MKNVSILTSLLLLMSCRHTILISVPNEFKGEIFIVENKKSFDDYYGSAYENYRVKEYNVGDDRILYVKDISAFRDLSKLSFSYVWCEPVPLETIRLECVSKKKIKLTFE